MPVSDSIGDFLTRLRNGLKAKHKTVDVPASKMKMAIAAILKDQGFINDYEYVKEGPQGYIRVKLRYFQGKPAIREIKRVSRPGIRKYAAADELPKVYNGLGIAVISTSHGVMTDKQARKDNVGGEVICTVW
ncbi:MAG: 30S ribosomal protein S8 [Candidatus Kapabacteria bacterium]|nr:30S ribosomal protein S8 [Candidatus Kapabacteria bacterium]